MQRWDQLKALFADAADLPPAERARFLDQACTGDTELREELEHLFEADRRDGAGIVAAVEGAAHSLFSQEGIVGSRIGPYLIENEIGAGGMGAVYLAVRDDEQYKKRVAVKLIRPGLDTQEILDRFLHERQILANLEHPYIARLLDGGAAWDGRPFLVMEYVQGEPLDVYCRNRDVELGGRCRLFLKVCQAVSYAHRSLVVHRDLKPGNILVTAEGSPKLLDFGVAKMLDAEAGSGGTTMTVIRPLTPDYASPEQIRGEPITTATDVYSLGAILYELLCGRRAHQLAGHSLREIERVICDTDPPKPSDVAPGMRHRLAGDLDAIVSMAMRKEASQRYSTVEHLAADVENYLAGRPVTARQGNVAYRTRKFLRRHRIAIAVTGLLAAALIGGAAAAALEARRAIREQARAGEESRRALESQRLAEASKLAAERESREATRQRAVADSQRRLAELQRTEADTQRQIADRRFQQVRQLAGKFLLDFHDAILNLPGSTPARKMVVETGLQYFDTLVREAHGNRDLLEEIARGYDRLGDVQGNPYSPNLGDLAGALASYQKAAAIRESISDPTPEFLRDRILGNVRIAELLHTKGDMAGSEQMLQAAVELGQGSAASQAFIVRAAVVRAYSVRGDLANRRGDYTKAIQPYTRALELGTQIASESPSWASEQGFLSVAHGKLGDLYTRLGRGPEALQHLHEALALDEPLIVAHPNSMPILRRVYIENGMLSYLFSIPAGAALAAPGEPRKVMEKATELADRMVASDPKNETALMDVVAVETIYADWLRDQRQFADALQHYRKAVDAAEKQAAKGPPLLSKYDALMQAHRGLGIGLTAAGAFEEAREHFQKADEYLASADKLSPGLPRLARRRAEISSGRAEMYAHQKNWSEAAEAFQATIAVFEGLRARDAKNDADLAAEPHLYLRLADCYQAAGQQAQATQALETALDRLREIEQRRPLLPSEQEQRKQASDRLAATGRR